MDRPTVGQLVSSITDEINSMSWNPDPFCKAMGQEHRTLQQSFTRLCFAWIKFMASRDRSSIDGRNQASADACRVIVETCEEAMDYLPNV